MFDFTNIEALEKLTAKEDNHRPMAKAIIEGKKLNSKQWLKLADETELGMVDKAGDTILSLALRQAERPNFPDKLWDRLKDETHPNLILQHPDYPAMTIPYAKLNMEYDQRREAERVARREAYLNSFPRYERYSKEQFLEFDKHDYEAKDIEGCCIASFVCLENDEIGLSPEDVKTLIMKSNPESRDNEYLSLSMLAFGNNKQSKLNLDNETKDYLIEHTAGYTHLDSAGTLATFAIENDYFERLNLTKEQIAKLVDKTDLYAKSPEGKTVGDLIVTMLDPDRIDQETFEKVKPCMSERTLKHEKFKAFEKKFEPQNEQEQNPVREIKPIKTISIKR